MVARPNQPAGNNSGDNRAIRLESDEDLVKIVTMHASKGLQYPLVYCPFAWDAQDTGPSDWQILHQSANRTELLAKAQLSEDEQKQYADEEMAERLRLLYVALTRAEEQLNIYAAYSSDTADNPLAYLIEGLPQDSRETVRRAYACEKTASRCSNATGGAWRTTPLPAQISPSQKMRRPLPPIAATPVKPPNLPQTAFPNADSDLSATPALPP